MTRKGDAKETLRFAILNALISHMPGGSHPYLEKASEVASQVIDDPAYAWIFKEQSE